MLEDLKGELPKKPQTSYIHFSLEQRNNPSLASLTFGEKAKAMGRLYQELSEEQKVSIICRSCILSKGQKVSIICRSYISSI